MCHATIAALGITGKRIGRRTAFAGMTTGMLVPVAWIKYGALIVLAGLGVFLVRLWQPARQVELHTLDLLERASARDWTAVAAMMSPVYRDSWGHDRESAVEEAQQLFGHFFGLQIVPLEPLRVEVQPDGAAASARMGVFGTGTAVAQAVMEEVRKLGQPFVFRWTKSGSWPWEWSLAEAGQEELAARYPR